MDTIYQNMRKNNTNYSKYACDDKDAFRIIEEQEDIRPPFFHDTDRIIYSLSYNRYIDKTQVFSFKENDHISKRMIHVQFVSKIARTIGRALSLNEDLIEAIALGHDLGHVPFGHVGEAFLSEISMKYDNKEFNHNAQSVRTVMCIENHGKGLNLNVQVLDGILCHNGEFVSREYRPKKKSTEDFLSDYNNSYLKDFSNKSLVPMTLEGCVVRICDIIGYLGRDIEDGIRLGIITEEDIPTNIKKILGYTNRDIINNIVIDVINHSINKDCIDMSESVWRCIKDLKQYNYDNIYKYAYTKDEKDNIKYMFNFIFESVLKELEAGDLNSRVYKIFLNDMDDNYLNNTNNIWKAIDYIAGMTDDFFIKEYQLRKGSVDGI